ncbi:MAG: acetate--CoA ligase family protein [Syntrophomonadaceae bacterium]|nr:acetate--CoA ligase family protein [Syntrophomonadaceae bacterium]
MQDISRSEIKCMLDPRSIAIVGASNNQNSIGGRPIKFLLQCGFEGNIYPINPKYESLQGLKCYPDIAALPEAADMLIVAVNANRVLETMQKAYAKGIKSAVVFSSGFGEIGEEGIAIQNALASFCHDKGIALMGPNCLGYINHWGKTTATFSGALERGIYKTGPAALIAQSGAVGGMLYAIAQEKGIGISYMIVGGNEAVLSTADYMEYVLLDEQTRVVASYMEGIKDVERLKQCARMSMQKQKPLVVMKVGRSKAGSRAAASHTGSIAGEDSLADAFFKQHGILRVDNDEQLFHCMKVFSSPKRLKGNRIGILSISGGAGVIMSDACEANGLTVTELLPETEAKLQTLLPPFGSPRNPVDITAQVLTEVDKFYDSTRCVIEDPNTDGVVIFIGLLEHLKDKLVPAIVNLDQLSDKPLVVVWMASNDDVRREFHKYLIPFFEDPDQAIYALGQLNQFRSYCQAFSLAEASGNQVRMESNELCAMDSQASGMINELQSKKYLECFGIPVTADVLTHTSDEALAAARKIGFPVVLKVVSKDIPHKSDIGGVVLNIATEQELQEAYQRILDNVRGKVPNALLEGILLSEMAPPGIEMLVGLKNDPSFGPVMLVGMGGIYVEIMKDVSTRILPVSRPEVEAMLKELKSYTLLTGARGKKEKDIDALVDTLLCVANMGISLDEKLAELDINPLLVFDKGQGVRAVDALLSLR